MLSNDFVRYVLFAALMVAMQFVARRLFAGLVGGKSPEKKPTRRGELGYRKPKSISHAEDLEDEQELSRRTPRRKPVAQQPLEAPEVDITMAEPSFESVAPAPPVRHNDRKARKSRMEGFVVTGGANERRSTSEASQQSSAAPAGPAPSPAAKKPRHKRPHRSIQSGPHGRKIQL